MNMNNPLENLRQLTEAVRMAGADMPLPILNMYNLSLIHI